MYTAQRRHEAYRKRNQKKKGGRDAKGNEHPLCFARIDLNSYAHTERPHTELARSRGRRGESLFSCLVLTRLYIHAVRLGAGGDRDDSSAAAATAGRRRERQSGQVAWS